MNFYAVIIGTEILNGRREDKHFEFIKKELAKYGHELFASYIIKDDRELMRKTYEMVFSDENAIMFSFGGIGSTPDDLTREIAAQVFESSSVVCHQQFYKDIVQRFAEKAFPHRIHMADLPPSADLIFNPINNMSGFSLFEKFFFVPGFPSMSHPMIATVIKEKFSHSIKRYRQTLYAHTSEETLITLMQSLPASIEISCLPMFVENKPHVELSLSSSDNESLKENFSLFEKMLYNKNIYYELH